MCWRIIKSHFHFADFRMRYYGYKDGLFCLPEKRKERLMFHLTEILVTLCCVYILYKKYFSALFYDRGVDVSCKHQLLKCTFCSCYLFNNCNLVLCVIVFYANFRVFFMSPRRPAEMVKKYLALPISLSLW